jgi:hypothetical protein
MISKRCAASLAALGVTALGVGLIVAHIDALGTVVSALGVVFLFWLFWIG